MSVQDIVEAYETRLRARWTPDGRRIHRASGRTLVNKDIPETTITLPWTSPFGHQWIIDSEWKENTREICGND
jgi:uncharacterized protein (DUF2126 family)